MVMVMDMGMVIGEDVDMGIVLGMGMKMGM